MIFHNRWFVLCLTTALVTALTQPAHAQIEDSVVVRVRSLMADRAYASAYHLLEKYDPDHVSTIAAALRTDIVLQGFTKSIGHQVFGLKDLGPDEDLIDLRNSNGTFEMVSWSANEELTGLLRAHPEDPALHRALADFLFDAGSKYGDNWLMPSDSLYALVEEHYQFVNDHGDGDAMSWYRQGFAWLVLDQADSAVGPLTTAVRLDPGNAEGHYNLAYASMQLDERDTAIREAQAAYEAYTDGTQRSDAARLAGIMFEEKDLLDSARYWLDLADKNDPDNYYTLRALLNNAIQSNRDSEASIREQFFSLAPENTSTYDDLDRLYTTHDSTLIAFYRQRIGAADNSPLATANLHFFLGRMLLDSDKVAAKKELEAARAQFTDLVPEDHEVFDVIDTLLSR